MFSGEDAMISIGEFSDVGIMEDEMMTDDASCMVNQ